MRKQLLIVFVGLLLSPSASGQSPQVRPVVHVQADLSEHWFLPVWSVTNVRGKLPDNTNLFAGLGYRQGAWWVEVMVQRQWGTSRNEWMPDIRVQARPSSKLSVFGEWAYPISQKAHYNMVIVDYHISSRWGVGVETENLHRPGRDLLGAGPRISFPVFRVSQSSLNFAVGYQVRPREKDVVRFYLVFNHRMELKR